MKYIGKKHLNSNMYKKIRMKEKDGKVVISAIPDEKYKNMELLKTSTPDITDTIDGLNDGGKIEEITKYFLRNNTIRSIKQNGGEIIVSSTSGRHLVINLSNKYLNILNLILDKYQNDRLKFLDKVSDKNLIHITTCYTGYIGHLFEFYNDESSYGIHHITKPYDLENELEVVHLNLMEIHHKKISKFDLDFLDEYLKEFINNNPNIIKLIWNCYELKYGFSDGNRVIELPEYLCRKYADMVYEHNEFIEKEEKKQLCLELK